MRLACAVLALCLAAAACGPAATPETEAAPAAPEATNARQKLADMGADLAAIGEYVRTSAGPECGRVLRMEDRGTVPETIGPAALRAHVGARVFDIHCAPVGQEAAYDGSGQLAVIFPPDSLSVTTLPCRDASGAEICWKAYSDPAMQAPAQP